MRRRQLIEIEDQSWCPVAVRDGLTDYLQFISDRTEPYAAAARLLADALRVPLDDPASQPAVSVIDLGSGAGGPWRRLVRRLTDAGLAVRVRLARRVLADAVACGQGIAVFESTTRNALCLFVMLLVPHVVWLATPFIRPFRWSRLLLTYLLPVIPTVAFVDGVVSCLRTYTPDELLELAESVDGANGYVWTAGHAGGGPIPMTYLLGLPVRREGAVP